MTEGKEIRHKAPPATGDVFERLVRETMQRLRWSRKKAETSVRRLLARKGRAGSVQALLSKLAAEDAANKKVEEMRTRRHVFKAQDAKPRTTLPIEDVVREKSERKKRKAAAKAAARARAQSTALAAGAEAERSESKKPRKAKKVLTPKQRLERAVGPDDGKRRGGKMFLQGGSPGLGKRN